VNLENGDGCSVACTTSSGCGNGVVEAGEDCDDGNANNNDACRNGCVANVCGDGFVRTGVEACDDGNTSGGDGCASDCTIESTTVSQDVGGVVLTVTNDTGTGATAAHPVVTSVGVPAATTSGTGTISRAAGPPAGPPGFVVMGTDVVITASAITPAPTTAAPLRLVFTIDASQVVPGQDETTVEIHKDGNVVASCSGLAGQASPDPCVGL